MAGKKRSTRAKGRKSAKASTRRGGGGRFFVRSAVTGAVHEVTAEYHAYLVGQRDPISGAELYVDAGASAKATAPEAGGAVVTEAAVGVPDDAVKTDAKAMAERGGQPKGSIAGPTIPQDRRSDRGPREATLNPLARGEAASGKVKAEGVDEAVAARHAASMNLPTDEAKARAMGTTAAGTTLAEAEDQAKAIAERGEE